MSSGLFVIGDPVSNLLNLKPWAILHKFLVRLAVWFFIVVASSIAIRPEAPSARAIHSPACLPFNVENASTFMTKMVNPSNLSLIERISSCCFLFAPLTQRITRVGTSSDICSGISFETQFRYTPFGAMTKAKLIKPALYNMPMLSIRTFDFPVPISIKNPKDCLCPAMSKAVC